jgi:hypothetical protein
MSELKVPRTALDIVEELLGSSELVVTLPPSRPINVELYGPGLVIARLDEAPAVSRAILACNTREPPPGWNGDPLAPSVGEAS